MTAFRRPNQRDEWQQWVESGPRTQAGVGHEQAFNRLPQKPALNCKAVIRMVVDFHRGPPCFFRSALLDACPGVHRSWLWLGKVIHTRRKTIGLPSAQSDTPFYVLQQRNRSTGWFYCFAACKFTVSKPSRVRHLATAFSLNGK